MSKQSFWVWSLVYLIALSSAVATGCTYATAARVEDAATKSCKALLASDELVALAAAESGLPVNDYLELACSARQAFEPMLRVVHSRESH